MFFAWIRISSMLPLLDTWPSWGSSTRRGRRARARNRKRGKKVGMVSSLSRRRRRSGKNIRIFFPSRIWRDTLSTQPALRRRTTSKSSTSARSSASPSKTGKTSSKKWTTSLNSKSTSFRLCDQTISSSESAENVIYVCSSRRQWLRCVSVFFDMRSWMSGLTLLLRLPSGRFVSIVRPIRINFCWMRFVGTTKRCRRRKLRWVTFKDALMLLHKMCVKFSKNRSLLSSSPSTCRTGATGFPWRKEVRKMIDSLNINQYANIYCFVHHPAKFLRQYIHLYEHSFIKNIVWFTFILRIYFHIVFI